MTSPQSMRQLMTLLEDAQQAPAIPNLNDLQQRLAIATKKLQALPQKDQMDEDWKSKMKKGAAALAVAGALGGLTNMAHNSAPQQIANYQNSNPAATQQVLQNVEPMTLAVLAGYANVASSYAVSSGDDALANEFTNLSKQYYNLAMTKAKAIDTSRGDDAVKYGVYETNTVRDSYEKALEYASKLPREELLARLQKQISSVSSK